MTAVLPAYDDIIQGLSVSPIWARPPDRRAAPPRPTAAADKDLRPGRRAMPSWRRCSSASAPAPGSSWRYPCSESMARPRALVEHYYGPAPVRRTRPWPVDPRVLTAAWRKPAGSADGHVRPMPYTADAHWRDFFIAADRRDLAEDARFADISKRARGTSETLYGPAGRRSSRDTTPPPTGWPSANGWRFRPRPANRLQDLETDPHLRERGLLLVALGGERVGQPLPLSPPTPVRPQHSHAPANTMPPRLRRTHRATCCGEAGPTRPPIFRASGKRAPPATRSPPIDPHKDPA